MSKLKVDTIETYDGSKSVQVAALLDTNSINAATAKTSMVDADLVGIGDSAASGILKKITWGNFKAMLPAFLQGVFRERLSADRSYYVRTDGSDSNNGLANTSGGAFLTIQKAIDTVASIDMGIYNVTTYCTGTFNVSAGFQLKTLVGAGKHTIRGINADMTSFVINATNAHIWQVGPGCSGTYELQYMRMTTTTAGNMLQVGYNPGGSLRYGNIDFGPCAGVHIQGGSGQAIVCVGPCTISGSAIAHATVYDAGSLRISGNAFTLTGTPNFVNGFAIANRGGILLAYGATFSGSATGVRHNATENGIISTNGVVFPGNAAGGAATGGIYS